MNSPIHTRLSEIRPTRLLDIGCGCGKFTATLASFCDKIEAIDPATHIIERCVREQSKPNVNELCLRRSGSLETPN